MEKNQIEKRRGRIISTNPPPLDTASSTSRLILDDGAPVVDDGLMSSDRLSHALPVGVDVEVYGEIREELFAPLAIHALKSVSFAVENGETANVEFQRYTETGSGPNGSVTIEVDAYFFDLKQGGVPKYAVKLFGAPRLSGQIITGRRVEVTGYIDTTGHLVARKVRDLQTNSEVIPVDPRGGGCFGSSAVFTVAMLLPALLLLRDIAAWTH